MGTDTKGYANPGLLIAPGELAGLLARAPAAAASPNAEDAGEPVVIDLRPAEAFAAGHIPGAAHLDLFGVSLIDTSPAPLDAFLWMIAHLLDTRGAGPERTVVVYDEQSGIRAARAFWFLELFDHPDPRLLDGGFGAWARGRPPGDGRGRSARARPPGPSGASGGAWRRGGTCRRRWARRAPCSSTRAARASNRGTVRRARRGGAIPGAVHIEWTRNLDASGAFKPAAALRTMYEDAGVTPDREVITYCQGGYRAAHSYLALRLLGYPRVRNYLGSWKEWGDRVDLPVERPAE